MRVDFFNGVYWRLGHDSLGHQTFQRINPEVITHPQSPTFLAGDASLGHVRLADGPEPPLNGKGWHFFFFFDEQQTIVMACIGPQYGETFHLLAATVTGHVELVEVPKIDFQQIPRNAKWRYQVISTE